MLVGREAIMKNSSNKRQLCQLVCTFDLGENTHMAGKADSIVKHDEVDITLVSYALDAAKKGSQNIRILCDDTDVFVLLVYWTWKANIQAKVQMQMWDGSILDINAVVGKLGDKYKGILVMHCLSGWDTVSYPC